MHTLETILSFVALLACVALLAQPILSQQQQWNEKTKESEIIWKNFMCSAALDAALANFVLAHSNGCLNFSEALHSNPNPFALELGGDSNHYLS